MKIALFKSSIMKFNNVQVNVNDYFNLCGEKFMIEVRGITVFKV
jgi:hypothetical protein